ncbi:IclR family transcriptional regulator [Stella humosa]|uniref:IclR family transcriptional regulator n=1 Tax=Stella humosa TaxID=94 RepID=A0A3N1MFM9_9PROT|nr:IclR family transcriptional regulator [Stella humosa]ROQ01945.1 IclR family transcriptional regulator [Stella humosa]BBK32334.1 transcriptional regulator [Stella humosa]
MTASDGSTSPLNVKSLHKAFQVLEAFRGGDRHLSLGELAAATGLDKSAVQRFTHTLRAIGYLEQDPATRRYALGRRVLDLAHGYLRNHPLVERAAPILADLRRTTRERVDLSLLDGTDTLYVFRLQSKRETFSAALVGRRVPLFCSAGGRAMLACMTDEVARSIVERSERPAFTASTRTEPARIMAEVRKARRQGYGFQVGEWRPAELVVAAAIVDRTGAPIGAVHIAASLGEWEPEDFERRMAPLVTGAAQAIAE